MSQKLFNFQSKFAMEKPTVVVNITEVEKLLREVKSGFQRTEAKNYTAMLLLMSGITAICVFWSSFGSLRGNTVI